MPLDLEPIKQRCHSAYEASIDAIDAVCDDNLTLISEVEHQRERVEELEAVLRPFAALATDVDRFRHEDDSTCPHRLKAGDIRRARTALSENNQEDSR